MFIKNRFRFTNDRCKKRKWKMTTETIKTKQRKTRKQNWKEMGKLSWTLTDTWFFIRTAISIMNINFQFRKYETKIKNKKKIYSLADEMLNYRLGVWLRLFVYIYWKKKLAIDISFVFIELVNHLSWSGCSMLIVFGHKNTLEEIINFINCIKMANEWRWYVLKSLHRKLVHTVYVYQSQPSYTSYHFN